MSDFDREAERERLREQYEQDRQERAATERMSELLLQGATMTNAHCSDCGDPIFRYEGQEFCATCEKAVDRETDTAESDDGTAKRAGTDANANAETETEAEADTTEEPTDGEHIEVATPAEETRVQFGDGHSADGTGGTDTASTPDATEPGAEPDTPSAPGERHEQAPPAGSSGPDPTGGAHASEGAAGRRREAPTRTGTDGDLTAARGSLERTLARLSRQAEAAEDPARAREYLAAAREAAETLSALGR